MNAAAPVLLAISHGTGSRDGRAAVDALVDEVRGHLPDVDVRLGHVDVQQPDVPSSLAAIEAGRAVVVVPLLLSAGYHVRVDLVTQTQGRADVAIAPALGPDDRLVDVLIQRLSQVGLTTADTVVLAAAGSSDSRANEDCRAIARSLDHQIPNVVQVAFLAAEEPRLEPALAEAQRHVRQGGRVVVASYLLAPGYFYDLTLRIANGACVTPPLLSTEAPVDICGIVAERYRTAASTLQHG